MTAVRRRGSRAEPSAVDPASLAAVDPSSLAAVDPASLAAVDPASLAAVDPASLAASCMPPVVAVSLASVLSPDALKGSPYPRAVCLSAPLVSPLKLC